MLVGTGATSAVPPLVAEATSGANGLPTLPPDLSTPPTASRGVVIAEHAGHGQDAGEGGESQGLANLPPELAFAVRITLLRGHLLTGVLIANAFLCGISEVQRHATSSHRVGQAAHDIPNFRRAARQL